jgi:hypothetical protein
MEDKLPKAVNSSTLCTNHGCFQNFPAYRKVSNLDATIVLLDSLEARDLVQQKKVGSQ